MPDTPKLICFTYAGGTSAFFDEIEQDLIEIDMVKPEYAGHGTRHKEAFYQSFDELADDIFCQIKSDLTGNYSFFGYSMGSITAVEVLKRVLEAELPEPQNVFLAAHEPHTKAELLGFSADELDEWVKDRTIHFGAVPEKLLNNKVFWRTYLPIYRADYTIIGKYEFEDLKLKSEIPAVIFYSATDTPKDDMEEWRQHFPCEFYEFSGNHFFIQQHHREMAKIIKQKMGVKT